MVDETDASIYDTALRELEEELSIPPEVVETSVFCDVIGVRFKHYGCRHARGCIHR